jgi:hypothetical protein
MGEQKHLHHRIRRKLMHSRIGLGLDFGYGFANADTGDSFDLTPQCVGRVGEQPAVKIL